MNRIPSFCFQVLTKMPFPCAQNYPWLFKWLSLMLTSKAEAIKTTALSWLSACCRKKYEARLVGFVDLKCSPQPMNILFFWDVFCSLPFEVTHYKAKPPVMHLLVSVLPFFWNTSFKFMVPRYVKIQKILVKVNLLMCISTKSSILFIKILF